MAIARLDWPRARLDWPRQIYFFIYPQGERMKDPEFEDDEQDVKGKPEIRGGDKFEELDFSDAPELDDFDGYGHY